MIHADFSANMKYKSELMEHKWVSGQRLWYLSRRWNKKYNFHQLVLTFNTTSRSTSKADKRVWIKRMKCCSICSLCNIFAITLYLRKVEWWSPMEGQKLEPRFGFCPRPSLTKRPEPWLKLTPRDFSFSQFLSTSPKLGGWIFEGVCLAKYSESNLENIKLALLQ